MITVEVSLVVQANILKIFPAIAHRPDEELKNVFTFLSRQYNTDYFRFIGLVEGIKNVYSEFDKKESEFKNVSLTGPVEEIYKGEIFINSNT